MTSGPQVSQKQDHFHLVCTGKTSWARKKDMITLCGRKGHSRLQHSISTSRLLLTLTLGSLASDTAFPVFHSIMTQLAAFLLTSHPVIPGVLKHREGPNHLEGCWDLETMSHCWVVSDPVCWWKKLRISILTVLRF